MENALVVLVLGSRCLVAFVVRRLLKGLMKDPAAKESPARPENDCLGGDLMYRGQKQNESRVNGTPQIVALNLYYTGQPQVYVRGPITGYAYSFSSVKPVQSVDLRDARFLLASPLFRLSR
jgi:hypothetical protein